MKYFLLTLVLLSEFLFAKSFTIMSYNVQNLFDSKHDYGKDDYTYLPLWLKNESYEIRRQCTLIQNDYWRKSCLMTDWNEEVVEDKIENLCRVIATSSPDIVLLQEVENKSILSQLFASEACGEEFRYLSLIEGPDSRGIDTAVASKFPIVFEKLHEIDLDGVAKPTRGILEVKIKLENKSLTVFSNHWPSQANPSLARFKAAEVLVEKAHASSSDLIVAAGDFNTIPSDSPHGINLVVRPHVYDSEFLARGQGTDVFPGTHWYRGHWGSLDKMFIFKKSSGAIKADYKSFQIFSEEWMFKTKRWTDYGTGEVTYHSVPYSFSWKNKQGYSDHLPLMMRFDY
ncbi:MAG: hypothetical protein CME64_05320 [Halobacteriovoraceae bacterium]|nr:hypothetical protein [Halobacteriovoraceae bacterium]|tara:strand:+ start:276153 stop:277178 length:1026 start_codon:yes stop_codon:yes gene_type:complete